MIELDLKGAGWLGRASAAVACHRQWRSVRRASGFTSRVSRARVKDLSRRAMRFSVRHLSGLIYDAVDEFVRDLPGTNERNHSSRSQMRFKAEAPSPDRSGSIFLPRGRRRSLTLDDLCRRRNLANAGSTNSSVAVGTLNQPIDGGSVEPAAICKVSCARCHVSAETQQLFDLASNRCTADLRCRPHLPLVPRYIRTGFPSKITSES